MEPIKPGDEITAPFLNYSNRAAQAYHNRKALGEGGRPTATPINNAVVLVRNNTGGDLRRGEVVELNGGLLSQQDPRYLPFAGATPDLTRIGWGITLQQIPSGSMNDIAVTGVCIAFVNITDSNHKYADVVAGSTVLQSAQRGPVKIIQPIGASPGEYEGVVLIGDGDGDYVDIVQVYHSDKATSEPVSALAEGVHPGKVKRAASGTLGEVSDCWILFVDQYDVNEGVYSAINQDYYGPARFSGYYTVDAVTLPLMVLRRGVESLVRFELTETLELGGNATAKLLDEGWGDTTGLEIEVFDEYSPEGMWAGIAGYRGLALRTEYTFDDEDDPENIITRFAYDIVWMEQIARTIQGTTTERMGATTASRVAITVSWFDHQGKEPVGTVIIRDPQGQYPDVHSGAKVTAVYDYHNGYYRIQNPQRVALFAEAVLSANLCGGTGTVGISSFAIKSAGDYVGSPPTTPTVANVGTIKAGMTGDKVQLRRIDNSMPNPTWEIVAIDHHEVDVLVNTFWADPDWKQTKRKIWVQVCNATETTTTVVTFGDCP